MTDQLVRTSLSDVTSDADRICSQCDYKLRSTNVCTCCHQEFNLYRVILFDTNDYDFEEYIVSWALSQKVRHCDGSHEYICKICHSSLLSSEVKLLQMPRKAAAHRTNEPGYKFLQAMCEKPEFLCTSCHRWLFHHSVMVYDEKKYNMNNSIVRETLDLKYQHPKQVVVVKGVPPAHEHRTDYGDSETDDEVDDKYEQYAPSHITYKSYEYICLTCHNNLKQKQQKMPAQACANGLLLSPVPPELQNLTTLEHRLIALHIPFMVIICMLHYGKYYKVWGQCTNVPATLDQIINMLPRMSNEVKYHPNETQEDNI